MSDRAHASLPPQSATPSPAVLQRCACGAKAAGAEECVGCRQKRMDVQRRTSRDDAEPQAGAAPPAVHRTLASPGQPMDGVTRRQMEARFGRDFGAVRIHADPDAADSALSVSAWAYTLGRHIAFARGHYEPGTARGRQLLAHELTHVLQQDGMRRPQPGVVQMSGLDTARERQADAVGKTVSPAGNASAQINASQSAAHSAPFSAAQRDPSPDAQLNLTIDERGQVDLSLSGPDLTVIPQPTLGVRRKPGGNYDLLLGAKNKTVAAGEVPQILKGVISAGRPAGTLFHSSSASLNAPGFARHRALG